MAVDICGSVAGFEALAHKGHGSAPVLFSKQRSFQQSSLNEACRPHYGSHVVCRHKSPGCACG